MVLLLRKRHLLTVVAAVALCGALLLTARPGAAAVLGSASPQRAVILDAGHGGADGGAVSDSGVAESGRFAGGRRVPRGFGAWPPSGYRGQTVRPSRRLFCLEC